MKPYDRMNQQLKELGWKDAVLYNALNISKQRFNGWKIRSSIPKDMLRPVAQKLSVSIEWLMTGKDAKSNPIYLPDAEAAEAELMPDIEDDERSFYVVQNESNHETCIVTLLRVEKLSKEYGVSSNTDIGVFCGYIKTKEIGMVAKASHLFFIRVPKPTFAQIVGGKMDEKGMYNHVFAKAERVAGDALLNKFGSKACAVSVRQVKEPKATYDVHSRTKQFSNMASTIFGSADQLPTIQNIMNKALVMWLEENQANQDTLVSCLAKTFAENTTLPPEFIVPKLQSAVAEALMKHGDAHGHKVYTPDEIEALKEKAAQEALEDYQQGLKDDAQSERY